MEDEEREGQTHAARRGLNEDWAIVESLLPEQWREKARELGAFRRARGITDPGTLLKVMLIHLADGCGLRETSARAAAAGLAEVSDVALLKRLKSCGNWFEWLGRQMRESLQPSQEWPRTAQAVLGQRRLRVVDGSMVSEPGRGSQWRLHYAIGLPDLQCQEVHLGLRDDGETLKRFSVIPGDVFMADRGYAHPAGIAHVVNGAGDVIVRMNLVTLPLHERGTAGKDAQLVDILEHVRPLAVGEVGSWPVSVHVKPARRAGKPTVIDGFLCAVRKSEAAAEQSRQRVRRESQRNQCQVRPETLEIAAYVLVFTTLQPEHVSAEQVLQLYRLRWQIELEFKRMKSLLDLGHLKKHDPQAARSWLQGKLLLAFILARLIAHAEHFSPWGYDIGRVKQAAHKLSVA